jgi:hypothetical protein
MRGMWTCRFLVATTLALATNARADDIDEVEFPNAVPTVMDKRWSVAMSYGPATLRDGDGDGQLIEGYPYLFADMAVRYRVVASAELGVSLSGIAMREHGYNDGYVSANADVRFRFAAERAWNPFLLGSIGVATFGDDRAHMLVRAGAGLERRFRSWAFTADAQITRISGRDDEMSWPTSRYDVSGALAAAFSLGAVYYWGTPQPRPVKHQIERLRR